VNLIWRRKRVKVIRKGEAEGIVAKGEIGLGAAKAKAGRERKKKGAVRKCWRLRGKETKISSILRAGGDKVNVKPLDSQKKLHTKEEEEK